MVNSGTTQVLMRRLLSLDYIIERPTLAWLPTEADKVQRFEALGIDRRTFPYRLYGPEGRRKIPRYFAFKLPIAVDEQAATFVYVDAGQSTDSELRAWGVAHAPLWAALRARTFAVHIVAVGTGVEAAQRAAPVLKRWTQDGDGQGAADPAGQTKADPDIRQEIARLEQAITAGNRDLLRAAGGFDKAADRLELLQQLPDGTPTKATARGAIDQSTTLTSTSMRSTPLRNVGSCDVCPATGAVDMTTSSARPARSRRRVNLRSRSPRPRTRRGWQSGHRLPE